MFGDVWGCLVPIDVVERPKRRRVAAHAQNYNVLCEDNDASDVVLIPNELKMGKQGKWGKIGVFFYIHGSNYPIK